VALFAPGCTRSLDISLQGLSGAPLVVIGMGWGSKKYLWKILAKKYMDIYILYIYGLGVCSYLEKNMDLELNI
jgi:hypothetical protein